MIEILRHVLGICGEHWHPNIFTAFLGLTGTLTGVRYLYFKYIHKSKHN